MARSKKRSSKKTRTSIRDRARQAAEKRERGGGGLDTLQNLPQDIEFFRPKMGRGKKGQNRFSIVPYIVSIDNHPFQEKGEPWPECTYWQHKIGMGTDSKRFICPSKTEQSKSKKCPICEYRKALIDSGSNPELAEELKPKQRQLFNILDHDNEDKGIQLLEMSPHMFGFMLDDEDKAQSEDFDDKYYGDFEDGLMIVARFNEGSFGGAKFPECARIDFEERDDLDEELVTEEAVDLDASLRILDYDTLNEKFFELENDEDEDDDIDDDDDNKKSKRKSKRSSSRKTSSRKTSKNKEDDDDIDDDDIDDDDIDDDDIDDDDIDDDDIDDDDYDDDDYDDDYDDNKKSKRKSKRTSSRKSKNKCPEGLEFGIDCDTDDVCDDCDIWEDCKDRQDELDD